MPFLTAGMYSRGMMPPTILFSTVRPLLRSAGRISTSTCPYWPRPPDCLMSLPTPCALVVIVSRYAFVCLNLDQTRNALALVRARIVNRVSLAQRARINSEENQLPHKRITPKFEGQRTKVAVVICRSFHRFTGVGVLTFSWRYVQGARQIIDHGIDQVLNADVLQRGAADDRHEFVGDRLPPNCSFQQFRCDFALFEYRFCNFVVEI